MNLVVLLIVFLSMFVGGFLLESAISQSYFWVTHKRHKNYHYTIARYIFFLIPPALAILFIFLQIGDKAIPIFMLFAVVGIIFEWLIGFSYHMIVGQRLWTYHRYSIGAYTSFLSVPLWGFGGVLFWLLVRVLV